MVTEESFESLFGLVDGGAGELTNILTVDEKILDLCGT